MKKFVIGDIHGGHKSLLQCLERSKFNYEKDKLVCLGDVADGWPETPQCIEELLKIKNLIYIIGNHDIWLDEWFKSGDAPDIWTSQGGEATMKAYLSEPHLIKKHETFFDKAKDYYLDENKNLFVHGGVSPLHPLKTHKREYVVWDRSLWKESQISWMNNIDKLPYNEIFIGHTITYFNLSKTPIKRKKVWNLDQGGGYGGKGQLSIMDIDTHKFWQSDIVSELYPNHRGRL